MFVDRVPNRKSNPTWLIRESKWVNGKAVKSTLANITKLGEEVCLQIKELLKGGSIVHDVLDAFKQHFKVVATLPHGHVAAALGTLRSLNLDQLIDPKHSRKRNIALALIASRILKPCSKLATAAALKPESKTSSLGLELGLTRVHENEIYEAMDWLFERKDAIEKKLAQRHLTEGSVVLCDVTSTYVEGYGADLAEFGYSGDRKKGKKQINFGLLCDKEGRPVGVEVFPGSVADPKTLAPQLHKLKHRFDLDKVTIIGDRGLLTHARLKQDVKPEGYDWITAMRKPAIRKLVREDNFQLSLFEEMDLAEITSDAYPGERLIVCRNPLTADRAAQKRQRLLRATEKRLDKLAKAVHNKDKSLMEVGEIFAKYKMKKHFEIITTEDSFSYRRKEASIRAEASLDGIYVIRTSLDAEEMTAEETVVSYKQLSVVEKAFRSMKTVDLKVRPIHHYRNRRIKCHIFLCMLAYYVQWHMQQRLAPMLFVEEDPEGARAARDSVVAPAVPSPATQKKARTRKAAASVTSFRSLMDHLATLPKQILEDKAPSAKGRRHVLMLEVPSQKQKKAFKLLGVSCK